MKIMKLFKKRKDCKIEMVHDRQSGQTVQLLEDSTVTKTFFGIFKIENKVYVRNDITFNVDANRKVGFNNEKV